MAFANDGANTMVDSYAGETTRLKDNLNPFIVSYHCVAHRSNLTTLDVSKTPDCKIISNEVDTLLITIVSFFNMSSKRRHALTMLQK